MNGVHIDWLAGNCPVQAEGTFDGTPFYFRARGTSVTCDVGDWMWEGPEYEWPDAGWISEDMARAFITEAYQAWLDPKRRERAVQAAAYRQRNAAMSEMMHAIRFAGLAQKELGEAAQPVYDWAMKYATEWQQRAHEPVPTPPASAGAEERRG